MKNRLTILFVLTYSFIFANNIPVLQQCNVINKDNTLEISFELSDSDNSDLEVRCSLFFSNGSLRNQPVSILRITGDIGNNITPGPNKKIIVELVNLNDLNSDIRINLSAYDHEKLDLQEIVDKVNKERLLNDLIQLQGKRNEATDKAFKEKAREYIIQNLNKFHQPTKYESKVGSFTNINFETNLWGTVNPQKINIIDAHYDSFGNAPGADDNASGVAGVLEIFRILSDYSFKKSIRYLFFDLEENGLVGSNLYVNNQLNINDTIDHVINFEMIGFYSDQDNSQELPTGFNILFPQAYNEVISNNRKGNFISNVGNTISRSLMLAFDSSGKEFVPSLKIINLEVPGNGALAPDLRRSDHANFWDKNIKALMITDGANFRNKNYHKLTDSAQYLNMDFMSQVVKTSLATLCKLAEIEHGTSRTIEYLSSVNNTNSESNYFSYFISNNLLYVNSSDNQLSYSAQIFDINGVKIYDNHFTGSAIIDIHHSSFSGLKFINFKSNKYSKTYKVIFSN